MGLVDSLFTGGSGLRSTQKWSEVTARNISNANTEGYVKKEVQFGTRPAFVGGGSYVQQIKREVDASLDRMYRYENSKMGKQQAIYEGIEEYTAILGQPDDEKSPASRLSALKNSFIRLSNSPANVSVQRTVVAEAENFVSSLRDTSYALSQTNSESLMEIKYEVAELNESLHKIAEINRKIGQYDAFALEGGDLQDELGRLVDSISEQMNIRTVVQGDGRVNLYSGGGLALVEGTSVNEVTYVEGTGQMFAGNLEITPFSTGVRGFEYGRLAGLMQIRNTVIPQFQLQLDELARSVIESFEQSDSSLMPGMAGLFTDNGNAFDPANLNGLANRIAVNDAVKPEKGGALWRVRDGIGATTQGPQSSSVQIESFLSIFSQTQTFDGGTGIPSDIKIEDYANNMVAFQQVQRTDAEKEYEMSRVSFETIEASRLSVQGVNIDDELQKLLVIEQSYAANSQLMKTVATMMDTLIGIV